MRFCGQSELCGHPHAVSMSPRVGVRPHVSIEDPLVQRITSQIQRGLEQEGIPEGTAFLQDLLVLTSMT